MSNTISSAKTQPPSNETIERVARALLAARYGPVADVIWREKWARIEETDSYLPRQARAAIEAHVAALAEAGFVIVPREPTEAMLTAGEDSLEYTQVCRSLRNMGLEAWRSMTEAGAA